MNLSSNPRTARLIALIGAAVAISLLAPVAAHASQVVGRG